MYKIEVTELILYLNTSTLFFYFLLLSLLRNRSHSYATERKYYSGKLLNVQHGIFVDSFWIRQAKNASKCILEKRQNSKTEISLFHFHTFLNGPYCIPDRSWCWNHLTVRQKCIFEKEKISKPNFHGFIL